MRVLILHGPNLNLLGHREPAIYGMQTLKDLNAELRKRARGLSMQLRTFQSNHEGALIDRLHAERLWMEGLVINPGALTHYSYSLRDAIEAVKVRTFEVHLSNIHAREAWRKVSVLSEGVEAPVVGKGFGSYYGALGRLAACED